MLIGWVLLLPTGILLARYILKFINTKCARSDYIRIIQFYRYYKNLFSSKTFFGMQFWYLIHRPLMITVLGLSILALLIILSDLNWGWVAKTNRAAYTHSVFGILTLVVMFFQIFIGVLRPTRLHEKRNMFNIFHRCVGIGIYLFAGLSLFDR